MRSLFIAGTLFATSALIGCIYDAEDRCGPGQVLDATSACVCAANHIPIKRDFTVVASFGGQERHAGCQACGENEVARNGACVCSDGFERGMSTCVVSNLGAACASDGECASGLNGYCKMPEGYCTTSGCAAPADCNSEADFGCETTATPTYCKRPPLNQGLACTTEGPDPACGPEAPMCAQGTCTVVGCTSDAACSPSRKCCDLSAFAGIPNFTLCMAGGCP